MSELRTSLNNADRKITYTSFHGYCDSGIGPD